MEQCRQIVGSFYKTNDYFLNSLACSFHLTKHAAATPLIEFFVLCTVRFVSKNHLFLLYASILAVHNTKYYCPDLTTTPE